MVVCVANVRVPVEDTDRAVDFYENILGLPVVKRDGSWAEVNANGVRIGLNGREPRGTPAEGGPVVTFRPEGSLEDAIEDLKVAAWSSRRGSPSTTGAASRPSRTRTATTSSSTSRPAAKIC